MSVQQLLPGRGRWWCAGGRKEATSRSTDGACQLGCHADAAGSRPPASAAATALLLPWLRALLVRPPRLLPSLALPPSLLLLLLAGWLLVACASAPAAGSSCCCSCRRRCRLSCGGPCCCSREPPAEGTSARRAWSHRLSAMASGTTAASVVALGTRASEHGSSAPQLLVPAGRSPSPRPARSVLLRERFCRSQHPAEPPGCRSRASAAQYTQSLESQLADRPSGRQPPSSGCRRGQGAQAWWVLGVGDVRSPQPQPSQENEALASLKHAFPLYKGTCSNRAQRDWWHRPEGWWQAQQHGRWRQRRRQWRRQQVVASGRAPMRLLHNHPGVEPD